MNDVETYEHEGIPVRIVYDEIAGDPFEEFDQTAELVWMDREHAYKNVDGRVSLDYEHYLDPDRFRSTAQAARYLTLFGGYLVALPFVFKDYGSGGTRTYICKLDDVHVNADGFVVVSQAWTDLTGAPDPEEAARQDFATWADWVEGSVFGYIVADGAEDEESCWGFYGDLDYVKTEANEVAAGIASERARLRALPWLPTFGKPIMPNALRGADR